MTKKYIIAGSEAEFLLYVYDKRMDGDEDTAFVEVQVMTDIQGSGSFIGTWYNRQDAYSIVDYMYVNKLIDKNLHANLIKIIETKSNRQPDDRFFKGASNIRYSDKNPYLDPTGSLIVGYNP